MVRVESLSNCRVNWDGSQLNSVNVFEYVVPGLNLIGTELKIFLNCSPRLVEDCITTLSTGRETEKQAMFLAISVSCHKNNGAPALKWAPAFAQLQHEQECSASFSDYKTWVYKVSTHEFADELILAAAADMLQLDLVVVPYTPAGSASQWVPRWSQHSSQEPVNNNRIGLGNDDVHYVLLF